jgi:hypothetical protein
MGQVICDYNADDWGYFQPYISQFHVYREKHKYRKSTDMPIYHNNFKALKTFELKKSAFFKGCFY